MKELYLSDYTLNHSFQKLWTDCYNLDYSDTNYTEYNQYITENSFDTKFNHKIINDVINPEQQYTYTRKIRFYPDKQQKRLFKECFGTHRFIYNKTLEIIKSEDKPKLSLAYLRPKVMKSDKDLQDNELWLKRIPYDTRQLAIKTCINSVKSSLQLLKNGKIKKFKHKFLSSKEPTMIFNLDYRALKLDTMLYLLEG